LSIDTMLHHGGQDGFRDADVFEVDDLVGVDLERVVRFVDELDHHRVANAGFGKVDNIVDRGRQGDALRNHLGGRRGVGRRGWGFCGRFGSGGNRRRRHGSGHGVRGWRRRRCCDWGRSRGRSDDGYGGGEDGRGFLGDLRLIGGVAATAGEES
jgi:hypothetical protein